jgi:hypothetical protein
LARATNFQAPSRLFPQRTFCVGIYKSPYTLSCLSSTVSAELLRNPSRSLIDDQRHQEHQNGLSKIAYMKRRNAMYPGSSNYPGAVNPNEGVPFLLLPLEIRLDIYVWFILIYSKEYPNTTDICRQMSLATIVRLNPNLFTESSTPAVKRAPSVFQFTGSRTRNITSILTD